MPGRIRQFETLEKIGQGGMGEVYRARDTNLQRIVAIKFLPVAKAADVNRQRRILQEAQAASALNHPNIITVHEVGVEDGMYFIVMEYVEGTPLDQMITRKGMRLQEVLKIGAQIADALACSHAANIIHRDLKPGNIMVRNDGLVKVLDFGLAKLIVDQQAAPDETTRTAAVETEEGAIVGTISYMSPEQVESRKLDARTDVFSFGAVLYEMVTGRRAFQGGSRVSTMSAILRDNPTWPDDRSADLPPELAKVIDRCLRKDPERRYQTIKDVKIALEEIREDSESGRLQTSVASRRSRTRTYVTAAVLVALVATLSATTYWRRRPSEPAPAPPLAFSIHQITDDSGTTYDPAISPDGKMVAYSSDRAGDAGLDIWIQQLIPGSNPIRLTRDPADETSPSFSPDGLQIAFASQKDGGGVYVMLAFGGEQQLVARGAFISPRFSPDGNRLLVAPRTNMNRNAFVISEHGGPPRRIAEGFAEIRNPVWSPDGKYIMFAGFIRDTELDWWVVPAEGGTPVPIGFAKFGNPLGGGPDEWIGNSLLYAAQGNLRKIQIKRDPWHVEGPVEPLTASTGTALQPRAIQHPEHPNRFLAVFTGGSPKYTLWELSIEHNSPNGRKSVARAMFADNADRATPSVSADGKRMVYVSETLSAVEIHGRDLIAGSDRVIAKVPRPLRARISPDGSTVATNPDYYGDTERTINLISWSNGDIKSVCDSCGLIYDWSPDGKRIVFRAGKPTQFFDLDPVTGKRRLIASDPKRSLAGAVLSPDQRWMAIQYALGESIQHLYIARVEDGIARPSTEWLPILQDKPGNHERPWWSPDGGHFTIYPTRREPRASGPNDSALQTKSPSANRS